MANAMMEALSSGAEDYQPAFRLTDAEIFRLMILSEAKESVMILS